MKILIPESEGKNDGGSLPVLSDMHPITEDILQQLENYSENLEKLYGVKGRALDAAIKTNKNIRTSKTMPAIERFKGIVYGALSYKTLNPTQKSYLNDNVLICTSLFGLIPAKQPIPNYKLKINKLRAEKLWKPENGKLLKGEFVIDLLPQAHKKSMYFKDGVRVEFIFRKEGKKIQAGHMGKVIKGKFIRWLAQNNITTVEQLLKFNDDDFYGEQLNKHAVEFVKVINAE